MRPFGFDAETSSFINLNLGADAYTRDPRTRCLMFGRKPIGMSDAPRLWREGDPVPYDMIGHIANDGTFSGWNVIGFDRLVYQRMLVARHGFPPVSDDAWKDSMHLAAAGNLPRSLDGCAKAVGVPHNADLKDTNRIRRITDANRTEIPAPVGEILDYPERFQHIRTTPQYTLVDDLQWLAARCLQDVEMEEQVLLRLPPWPGMEPWISMPAIDRRVNDRGVMIDLPLVHGLAHAAAVETSRLDGMMNKLTGGEVAKTTNIEPLKTWLIARKVELPRNDEKPKDEGDETAEDDDDSDPEPKGGRKSPWRLRKNDIADLLARTDVPEECRLALGWRAEAAKASTGKLRAMVRMADDDWRLRGILLLGGAQQTMRWSSVKVQLHNTLRDAFANLDDIADTNGLNAKTDSAQVRRLADVALAAAIEVGRTGDVDLMRSMYDLTRRDAQGRSYHSGVIAWVARMVRRCITVRDGMVMLNGDWAQVEARITVWLSQQTDMLAAFASGGDVYRIAAAGIFRCGVEQITKLMRQTGKVCIAEGSLVLTDQGLVPIEKVTCRMKVWDGLEWVSHSGAVCNGFAETIEYDGLRATSDHLVWTEGQQTPMGLGDAAASKVNLARTEYGGKAVRLGDDHLCGEKRGKSWKLVCRNTLRRMRYYAMDIFVQPYKQSLERLSAVFSSQTNSIQARSSAYRCTKAVSKLQSPTIQELRKSRHTVSFSVCFRSWFMGDEKPWTETRQSRTRPNRQQRTLCSREPSVGYPQSESNEHADKQIRIVRRTANSAVACDSRYSVSATEMPLCGQHTKTIVGCVRNDRGTAGSDRQTASNSKATRRVWDILNAGPRNRFTVSGRLVHNCTLALGFGGGPNALVAMGYNYGLLMSAAEAAPIVQAFREANSATKAYWYATDDAAASAVLYPGREFPVPPLGLVSYFVTPGEDCLCCRLPSDRLLRYWQPRLRQESWADGNPKSRLSLSGLAIKGKAVFPRSLYHTTLVENQVQAIAADLLATALSNTDRNDIAVNLHVHDNLAAEVREKNIEQSLPIFRECMLDMPSWTAGLPIGVEVEAAARFG